MRLGGDADPQLVVLSHGTQLFPDHLEGDAYNFGFPLGEVTSTPFRPANHSLKSGPRAEWMVS